MILHRQWQNARDTIREFPGQFWLLVMASFIDRLGGSLVFTYFSLYITDRFNVGLTEAGIVFAIFGILGIVGSFFGGALSDRFGRKGVIIIGLVLSAVSTLGLGFATEINQIYLASIVAGFFFSFGHPASHAMIADMLPPGQRAEGFSIFRVGNNLAIAIGPLLGALLVAWTQSFLLLFIADAITSVIMAAIVAWMLQETHKHKREEDAPSTFGGYLEVLRDGVFMAFTLMCLLAGFVYFQMYSTLPVFLRDVHAIPPEGYGYILSMNAAMVALFQFWITRKMKRFAPMVALAIASLLYVVGFGMYGFVTGYALFVVAMIIITIGEMIFIPTAQGFAADLSPENMRGRYMAIFSYTFTIPSTFGTLVAGLITDNGNPYLIWYVGAIGAGIAAIGFLVIHQASNRAKRKREVAPVVT